MTDERWRCFVAIPLSDGLRAALAQAVTRWRGRDDLAGLRWTEPESWHVTLAFLGSVPAEDARRIVGATAAVVAAHARMKLPTDRLWAFPAPARARVVASGISDADRRLAAVASDLRRALEVDDAKPWRPHVTLARAIRRETVDVRSWLAGSSVPEGELDVARVDLMRSHSGVGPARSETLASIPLGVPARA